LFNVHAVYVGFVSLRGLVTVVVLVDVWNDGQLDDDEAEPISVSSHSEVAQLEDIAELRSSHVAEGADDISLCSSTDTSAV